MKKNLWQGIISLVLVIVMMFVVILGVRVASPAGSSAEAPAAAAEGGSLGDVADGTYTGEAQGFGGTIVAEVTIAGGAITDIKLTGDAETPALGGVAIEKLPERILAAQSIDVDGISGATVSSNAIFEAVANALASAGIDASTLVSAAGSAQTAEKTEETMDVDVVVVGAGGAGMAAAITLKQEGADVLILEKMPYVGGNTTKASGGLNAAGTKMQAAAIEEAEDEQVKESLEGSTVENFIADTMEGGHQLNDIDLVRQRIPLMPSTGLNPSALPFPRSLLQAVLFICTYMSRKMVQLSVTIW
ncbi:MAG: FAD-dependent oxidoreductase [Lachnospiraceae bacterium]|nr:FAD-dependent oxidoreductase [Candidatus Equihabitans merdae]